MSLLKERLKLEERECNYLLRGCRFPVQDPKREGVRPVPHVEAEELVED